MRALSPTPKQLQPTQRAEPDRHRLLTHVKRFRELRDDGIRQQRAVSIDLALHELPRHQKRRGELVRLLDADGIAAIGIDSNHGQIADGEDRLFVEMDLFHWLDAQEDSSHRAIVSMHVVEHLPLPLQVRLIFEARRVLAEGGALILETPNALSISTAATNFWVDPTHQRPVHPAFLEFLADEAGFSQIELLPLHQLPVSFRGGEANPELVEDLNSLILGKGDLALIAHR